MSRRLPEELEEEIIIVLEDITESIQSTRWYLNNPQISRNTVDELLRDDFITLFNLLQDIRSVNNNQWRWPRSSQYRNHNPIYTNNNARVQSYDNTAYLNIISVFDCTTNDTRL